MSDVIVVGTDGSETANRALGEALRLAKALECPLHIVCAYEPLRGVRIAGAPEGAAKVWEVHPDDHVERVAQQAAAAVRLEGLDAETHTVTGDPADALLEVADMVGASMIVVGSRGMHGVKRMLGSVANKVSHRAGCSVLIVATDKD
jgi:nucleotide-binding universal stress UspA family protein